MRMQPVAPDERIEAIDMMRGVALLGILLINMLAFHLPFSYIDPYTYFQAPADQSAFMYLDIFVQTSFYPLFSMLFGYGLMMQFMRAEKRQQPFIPLAVRRLVALLAIGLVHAFLIWYGDILITYALLGFLLIFMLRLPSAALLVIGFLIYSIPHALFLTTSYLAAQTGAPFYTGIEEVISSLEAYAQGSYLDIFQQRFADWSHTNNLGNAFFFTVTILPYMMAGAAAAKWRMIEQARRLWKVWAALLAMGIGGLVLKALPFIWQADYFTVYLQDFIGGPLVAIGYAAAVALAAQQRFLAKLMQPLAKTGRMSLTTYIAESVIATAIFYNYGFGLYGQIDVMTGTWIALGIYALLMIFAELWLMKFRQGPLEILWRKATYGIKKSTPSGP
ncbi:DUF418 domain-containing protein [Indiicoccus explosivorum]|uniref:DUF418 domain-containing protein n=1 Tax=Indiicoccus explosivorum TaxID=1917864 RepID=UPI000B44E9EF|nr:DUF418 domain-containing protein [Indiicoccus explosivorum]